MESSPLEDIVTRFIAGDYMSMMHAKKQHVVKTLKFACYVFDWCACD